MNKFFMNRILPFFSILAISLFFLRCSNLAGGTEVGNPATIVGRVQDENSHTLRNAKVYLVTPKYNAITDSLYIDSIQKDTNKMVGTMSISNNERCFFAKTDNNGNFSIHEVLPCEYNLYITDSSQNAFTFKKQIKISQDSVNIGTVQVNKGTYASINISDSIYKGNGYITTPGTPVKISVGSSGVYTVPLTSDSLNIIYYTTSGDSISSIKTNVKTKPADGDTVDLTGIEHILIPPSLAILINNSYTFSPPDTIMFNNDTIFQISAIGAFSNKGHILDYQFYEASQNLLSSWSTSSTYLLAIKQTGSYQITCRVRSHIDNSVITSWTPSIRIRFTKPNIITNTAPTLIKLDSLPIKYSDTSMYRIYVHSSQNTDSLTSEYRLRWIVDSIYTVTPWQQNPIIEAKFLKPGNFFVQGQIRNTIDTTLISNWSDSLLISTY